jgi:hypothetical protein
MRHFITAWMQLRNQDGLMLRESAESPRGPRMIASLYGF